MKQKLSTVIIASAALLGALSVGLLLTDGSPTKADIKQSYKQGNLAEGRVTSGENLGGGAELKTSGALSYEAQPVKTEQAHTTGVALQWDQDGAHDAVEVQVRVQTKTGWTDWVTVDDEDRPDTAPVNGAHSGFVLADGAKDVQYRASLNGEGQTVSFKNPRFSFIDASVGPDPTAKKTSLVSRAKAADVAPRIISRAEWGCPEATSSPSWTPEYWALQRVMVHHTVTAGNPPNGAAAVRSIWQSHAVNQGWGDIGYNYLVDVSGNIFQGRYFDAAFANTNNVVVEGGHTLGFNRYSAGIATIGNFDVSQPYGQLNESVSNIAGYLMSKANLAPWRTYVDSSGRTQYMLSGHRDYTSTACPGQYEYAQLGNVRNRTNDYVSYYMGFRNYDYSYQGQGVNGSSGSTLTLRTGQTASVYLDLKNEGLATWQNSGANPVRLGTDRYRDRPDGFADPSWVNPARPGTFTEKVTINGDGSKTTSSATSIAPGEIARFSFTLRGGTFSGTHAVYYRPLAEGLTWFSRDLGIYWTVTNVPDSFSYQWLTQSGSVSNLPNTPSTLSLTIKNTGNVAWTNTGDANTIRIGTSRPNDRSSGIADPSWQGPHRIGTFAGKTYLDGSGQPIRDGGGNVTYDNTATSVQPGEAATFVFQALSPNRPYAAAEFFNLVVDGKAWLNDSGIYWPVSISQGYRAQWAGQSAFPTITKATSPYGSIFVDFKNTGTYPWVRGGVVSLAPTPMDQNSPFAAIGLSGGQLPTDTDNWLTRYRVGTFMAGKVVGGTVVADSNNQIDPGETARFMVALDASTVSARVQPYRQYFRLVADGFAWLEDFGVYEDITVR